MLHSRLRLSMSMFGNGCMRTMTTNNFCVDAKKIFEEAVKSVQPWNLIENNVQVNENYVHIQGKTFVMNHNVYIVGFGKAVLGMASALEKKVKDHLISGIISIPVGMKKNLNRTRDNKSLIEVYEGAEKNIPDEDSFFAASKISKLVSSLKQTDLLFVLISGGGSALLPSPKYPVTLKEKQNIITALASKGATIEELNSVRKRLSTLKGGGLALQAAPAPVISLIISDIIGDSLSSIASGPTVQNTDDDCLPFSIIEKYNITADLPNSALNLLKNDSPMSCVQCKQSFDHVNNFIIGDNRIALRAAAKKSEELHYCPIIVTHELKGIASNVGEQLISMMDALTSHKDDVFYSICKELQLNSNSSTYLINTINKCIKNGQKACVLFGGETTVKVSGTGVGGRNQELALAASLQLGLKDNLRSLVLLSAGTDGIDGPTTAAGGIATNEILKTASDQNIDAEKFLRNNDSFTFYSQLNNGKWIIQTGHTGTNVMDLIIILIDN